MAKRTTRQQLVLQERAKEARREYLGKAEQGSAEYLLNILEQIHPTPAFERFPLVPIEKDDPLWHCEWCCHCGCRRMPPELSGGFCLHCFHEYQVYDPEMWLDETFPHSEAAHLKNCANYQEYHEKTEEGWAKFSAMTPEGTDQETFSKLMAACYSKAIDDNYDAYMRAPVGSPERAAIVEKIVIARAQEKVAKQQEFDATYGKRKPELP